MPHAYLLQPAGSGIRWYSHSGGITKAIAAKCKLVAEIKTATVDDKGQALEVLGKLLKNQYLVTVGHAELLQAEADAFDQVYDYRKPLDQPS